MDASVPTSIECPSCGAPTSGRAGAWLICTHCGSSFPAHPLEVAADGVQSDDLGAAALTPDRLRDFLHGPTTPAEHTGARRFPGGRAEDRRRR